VLRICTVFVWIRIWTHKSFFRIRILLTYIFDANHAIVFILVAHKNFIKSSATKKFCNSENMCFIKNFKSLICKLYYNNAISGTESVYLYGLGSNKTVRILSDSDSDLQHCCYQNHYDFFAMILRY
jgi:hypothetical protein